MLVGVLVVALALYEITPKSGEADLAPLSAFGGKADMTLLGLHVR
jgi:hypothetical protein